MTRHGNKLFDAGHGRRVTVPGADEVEPLDPFGFVLHADDMTAWQGHLDAAERDAAMLEAMREREREELERNPWGEE